MRRNGWRLSSVLIAAMGCSQDQVNLGPSEAAAGAPAQPVSTARPWIEPAPAPGPVLTKPSVIGAPPAPAYFDTMTAAAKPPPAISGGTLVLTKDGRTAVAADPDRDQVYVVDLTTDRVATVPMPPGSEPGRVALDDHGRAHVALRNGRALARIELTSATLEATTALCQYPRGVAYDRNTDAIAVACASGELFDLDAQTHAQRSRVVLDRDLRDVIVSASGSRYVSRYRSAELLKVERDGTVSVRSSPGKLELSGFGEPTIDGQTSTFHTSPTLAWRMIESADGGAPWMLHERAIDDAIVPARGYSVGAPCGTITRPSLTHFDEQGNATRSLGLGVPLGLAVDQAFSADGQWIAVTDPSYYVHKSGAVMLARTSSLFHYNDLREVAAPNDPAGKDFSCSTPGAFWQLPDSQVTSVAFDPEGRVIALSRMPAQLDILTYPTDYPADVATPPHVDVHTISLSSDRSVQDSGHDLFHAATATGMSCASCHGEALDDGHVWNFADLGPRRTQNIRGGILQTLPLHWGGDVADVSQLAEEVMMRRMGGFIMSPEMSNALGRWIDALPALTLDASDPAAAQRGKQLFEAAEQGCTECHSGPHFTNNQSYSVGTEAFLQVPTLSGLALRAPFMHDGCAKSLLDRFGDPACGGGLKHGLTSQLSAAQISDLVTYLETL